MIEQRANVHWEGAGKTGRGSISTGSGALQDYPYGFTSRFEGDRKGTNPEEIVGAAHAACFTMAFAFACERAGHHADRDRHDRRGAFGQAGRGFLIDRIALTLEASIPGIDEAKFQQLAPGRQAELPAVQGAGRGARDHAGSEAARLKACCPVGSLAEPP